MFIIFIIIYSYFQVCTLHELKHYINLAKDKILEYYKTIASFKQNVE